MYAVAPLIDESSGESPLTVEYPGNGVVRFNAAIRVAIKRYNHAVTWATKHFISLISISKKYESNFKEISKLHLLVVIYECTSGQRKHSPFFAHTFLFSSQDMFVSFEPPFPRSLRYFSHFCYRSIHLDCIDFNARC